MPVPSGWGKALPRPSPAAQVLIADISLRRFYLKPYGKAINVTGNCFMGSQPVFIENRTSKYRDAGAVGTRYIAVGLAKEQGKLLGLDESSKIE